MNSISNDYLQHKSGRESETNREEISLLDHYTFGLADNQELNKETLNYIDEMKTRVNTILVAIRVRPLNTRELTVSNFDTIKVMDQKVICLLDPQNEFESQDVKNLLCA